MSDRYETTYDELYGQRVTREELLAKNEENRKLGRWTTLIPAGATDDEIQPWHVGWHYGRDGGADVTGEWQPSGSWHASRIVRPSYRQDTCIKLILSIYGKYRSGGVRPSRWSASLKMGWREWWIPDADRKRWSGSCKSIAEAMRKADAIEDLDGQIRAFLKHLYSPSGATAVFRQGEDGEYQPCFTHLSIVRDPMSWEQGRYMETSWDAPTYGPDVGKVLLHNSEIDRSWMGYAGNVELPEGATPRNPNNPYPYDTPETKAKREARYALVRKLGCWLPKPEPARKTEAA